MADDKQSKTTADASENSETTESKPTAVATENSETTESKTTAVATEKNSETTDSPEIFFEPIVKLPSVEIKTLEENEDVLLQIRAKLYRYDTESDPNEWKERGVGDCRILKHKETGFIRILMRRDKTLKICANHYINPDMELKQNCGSERAWVWSAAADFADEECKKELLAIRFGNVDNAQKFKSVFDESRTAMKTLWKGESAELDKLNSGSLSESKESDKLSSDSPAESKDSDKLSSQLKDISIKEG